MESFIKGHILNLPERHIVDGVLHVKDGMIDSISRCVVNPDAPYIMPGFIDAHVHIESTMLIPSEFARVAVTHGTVAAIADPHEIANVLGVDGIDFMIENSRLVRFHFLFGAPSCVPSTPFETSGAALNSQDITSLLERKDIGFLSEMMNFTGVVNRDPEVLAKITAAHKTGKVIDGHAPGLSGDALQQYIDCGISTDHECTNEHEAEEKINRGMMILIRQGSAGQNMSALMPIIGRYPDRLMFCTDDKHPNDLLRGHIDALVRKAVQTGYDLWDVLQIACVNPIRHYGLKTGALQKGDSADFIVVDNLKDFNVQATYIMGNMVFDARRASIGHSSCASVFVSDTPSVIKEYPNNFNSKPITISQLRVEIRDGRKIKVMIAKSSELLTNVTTAVPKVEDGNIVSDVNNDILKIVVYNRYQPTKPSISFIKGFGLQNGAIASTIAHDSHNIIAIGTTDDFIAKAINELIRVRGGITFIDGKQNKTLQLPIAGLMSPLPAEDVAFLYESVRDIAHNAGCSFPTPFMTMSFMALPVIPALKLTDKGLFDVSTFSFTSIFA